MKLLLDTHVLLWWLRDDRRLSQRARAVIADSRATVLVSFASGWELSVRNRIGKIAESGASVMREAVEQGFQVLGPTADHLAALEGLPRVDGHGDPFDQLLLAQTAAEGAVLMTGDKSMTRYGVPCIGVA